ncbi:MAG: UvrB/UvrC motif-containing protein, partial [Planctomycetota bacterium]
MGKQCQSCGKREAKIHFTEIKDGKKTELHICEQCAQEKNIALAFPSLLQHIMKEGGAGPRAETEPVPSACPGCGLPYAEFKAKGRLGCPKCYDSFAPVLVPLLEKVHGKGGHVGKTPGRFQQALQTRRKAQQLDEDLRQAIAAEDYERAARLRDRIRELKGDSE